MGSGAGHPFTLCSRRGLLGEIIRNPAWFQAFQFKSKEAALEAQLPSKSCEKMGEKETVFKLIGGS